jgi:hypothetical protein
VEIVLLVACAVFAIWWGYSVRELWTDPHAFWNRYRSRMRRGRARTKGSWLGLLYVDVFGIESNKRRYIIVYRAYFLIVIIGMLLALGVMYFGRTH